MTYVVSKKGNLEFKLRLATQNCFTQGSAKWEKVAIVVSCFRYSMGGRGGFLSYSIKYLVKII